MNLRGALAIFKDELHRFFRTVFGSILSPVLTTSLYLVVFGAAIGSRMDPAQFGGASYGAFIVPGLLMLTLLSAQLVIFGMLAEMLLFRSRPRSFAPLIFEATAAAPKPVKVPGPDLAGA